MGPVVKVGGSLLELDSLARSLSEWSRRQTAEPSVYIAGGGRWADAVRHADRIHRLGPQQSHWMCVSAMSVTAKLLATLIPAARYVRRIDQIDSSPATSVVLEVEHFLRTVEPTLGGEPLPRDWLVSSDSIAARVATAIGARELVLLKSTLPATGASIEQAAQAGFVDAFFPNAARAIPQVRCVNLRSVEAAEMSWQHGNAGA